MVSLRDINYTTGVIKYAISSAADLAKLPTMTTEGIDGNGNKLECAKAGSSAITTSGDFNLYMLDGDTNEWKVREK